MKTLVIGSAGFLGFEVVQQLLGRGRSVTAIDFDPIPEQDRLHVLRADSETLTDQHFQGVSQVYVLSGVVGTSDLDHQIPKAVKQNIMNPVEIFELALRNNVETVFFPSKPHVGFNIYTITKAVVEDIMRVYNQAQRTAFVGLRCFNVYGPRQKLTPVRRMIPLFAAMARRGLPLEIYGDGEQTVDMVFSRDIAKHIVDFTDRRHTHSLPDAGSGQPMTVNQVAHDVNAWFKNTKEVRHLPMRQGEAPNTSLRADLKELNSVIGDAPRTPWQYALDETLRWYASLPDGEIDGALRFYGVKL